jgi:hypothetical protein
MKRVLDKEGFPTSSHFDAYNGGSNGHSIDNTLVPGVWEWLRKNHHPSMPPAQ